MIFVVIEMSSTKKTKCKWHEPQKLATALMAIKGDAGLIWLDGDGSALGRWVTLAVNPVEVICCRGLPNNPQASNPFQVLKHLSPGHWTGWLNYEAGAWVEPLNPWRTSDLATLWIARHDPILKFDLKKRELWIEGESPLGMQELLSLVEKIDTQNKNENKTSLISQPKSSQGISIDSWEWLASKNQYINNVKNICQLIASGDIFQANLSNSCFTTLQSNITPLEIFQKLRSHCPAPFGGLVIASGDAYGEAVISSSPERFIKVLPNGKAESRPIKGTRPRHTNPIKDAAMAAELITSTKDRAENIMIVDLLRNDLSKVCLPGSISVPELIKLESFQQVHHLTSVITGQLQKQHTWVDLLQASWPGGSISGAPKPRACQRLHDLEPIARGPYCGCLINIDWSGKFDSSIIIRSLIKKDTKLQAYAGCGIVADSDPFNEADELNWKLMPLLKALE